MKVLLLLSLSMVLVSCQKERKPCKFQGIEVSCEALEEQLFLEQQRRAQEAAQNQNPESKPDIKPEEKPEEKKEVAEVPKAEKCEVINDVIKCKKNPVNSSQIRLTAKVKIPIRHITVTQIEALEFKEDEAVNGLYSCALNVDNGQEFKFELNGVVARIRTRGKMNPHILVGVKQGIKGTWTRRVYHDGGYVDYSLTVHHDQNMTLQQDCVFQ